MEERETDEIIENKYAKAQGFPVKNSTQLQSGYREHHRFDDEVRDHSKSTFARRGGGGQ